MPLGVVLKTPDTPSGHLGFNDGLGLGLESGINESDAAE
jgi:hypothetical protein